MCSLILLCWHNMVEQELQILIGFVNIDEFISCQIYSKSSFRWSFNLLKCI